MNIFKFFVTAIMIGSTITISAANKTEDSTQQANPEQVYYQWENLYKKCINAYDSCINVAKKENKLKKLKMSKEEFNSYKNLCSKLEPSIEQMKSTTDFNTPIDFDINKWDSLSCKFREVIKNNIKDLLKNDDKTKNVDDKIWEEKCSALKNYYSNLYENYKNKKFEYAENLIKENNDQKIKISQLETQIKDSTLVLNNIRAELNKYKTDKINFGDGLQKAYEVCVYFPLAVKYNEQYVNFAHTAASEMINSGKGNIVPEMKNDWKNYEPLLLNYGKYNDAFIKYIERQKTTLLAKPDKKITPEEVEFNKSAIKLTNDYPILKKYFTKYYNTDVSISYLDKAINEYFNTLSSYAKSGKELNAKVFDNFISIHLK